MILKPFLSNQPYILLLLFPVLVGFYSLNFMLDYHDLFPIVDMGLWGKSAFLGQWWSFIPAGICIVLNAFQLNALFNEHEFLERNNYGPSLFYVTFMSFSHSFYQLDGLLIAQMCWLQVIRLLFQVKANEDNRRKVFNAAFFVGLSATFHTPSAGLLLLFWFALWILKPAQFREWTLSLFGFSIPVFNALMYWWFSGHRIDFKVLQNTSIVEQEEIVYYLTSGLVLILCLLSIAGIQIRLQKSTIRFKKLNRVLLWILLGGVLLGSAQLFFYQQIEWFNFIFIPLSFFFTFAFIHRFWKVLATFFFYATFLLAVVKYFLYPYLLV